MNSLQEQILKERNAELETALGNKMLELRQKTRDLEIEAALERVRSSALAMKQPADMLNICRIIAGQLEVLNVREIRNVQTAIFYPAKSAYVNYEFYVKHDKTLITEVDYSTHTVQSTFAEQMMKGPNEFFTQGFKGKEVQDWYAYQKTTNVFLDSYLETVSSLNYYWFSLGPVALGMSAYQPLSEDQIILFQRFRNVFGLAYRRYLDIEKAEAQAREAQIQLALERIRARTMAMRKSDEISDAVYLLFEQFKDLGEDPIQITIGIFNEEEKVIHLNITGLDGSGSRIHQLFKMEIDEPSLLNKLYKAWKAQKKSIVLELAGQELLDWITYRNAIARNYNMAGTTIASNERRFISAGLFSKGFISFSKSDLIPGQTTEILKRFAGVFDSTYTRFLDLQKAEAQARESRIQLALERARSQSMMMKHSRELDDTLRVFHEQVLQLNIPSAFSFLWLPDEVKDEHIFWAAWAENNSFKSKAISYPLDRNDPATAQCLIDWKSNQPVVAYHVPPGGVPAYFASWSELIAGVEELTPEHFSEGLYYVEAFMKYGCFGIMVKQPLSEDNKKILERFAIEFERAYTRFLDLQKAEEQAREAQVEAALERVRSRTLAMHKSDELAETAAVVFRQLIGLGIAPNRLYIGVIKDETGEKIELWATDEDGTKVSTQFTGNVNRNESIKKMYEGWKTQQKSIIIDMQGKELADYFHYLSEELNVPFQLGLTQKRRVQTIAYFSQGFIGMASPDPQTDETTKLLERFAYVFNLTYTRFNDLQHAEDQTRKAQIEVALERVRARALAMQTSGELIEVAHAMREQMGILGQPDMETAAVHLYTKDAASFESWYAFRPIRQSTGEIITGTATFAVDSCELVREFVAIHFSGVNEYTIEVDEFKQLEWNKVLATAIPAITEVFYQEFKGPLPKTYFHFSDFSGGSLVMVTYQPPSEDVINLQHRAASVFDLAYRRFLDLQHKEEQALRLLQEKERLEFTLTELRATQSQLIQSEKMASLGELTAGIAHEIQNPLNFVNNFSDINSELIDEQLQELKAGNIQDAIEIANDIKQNEEKINHHGKRADSIVKGMLQHSRSSTGQKEPTDVNKLADEYLRLSYHGLRAKDHGFNAEIETNFDDSIGSIKIIPQDIGRVLLNLYNNAFYAVGERRKLEGLGYEPTVSLNTKKMDDKIEIEVADNGSGIPQKVVDKIFQPFFTTKPTGQGTGLGLSLSYDIVKAHGGEIKVESSEGIGTTFIIHIPVT